MSKFKWIAKSDDGAFQDESTRCFATRKECYEDMRNHALEKMKWNTEYDEDFLDLLDGDYIGYEVKFKQDEIVHTSYSGVYTYKIVPIKKKFAINVSFCGSVALIVEAEDEKEALKIAQEREITDEDILNSCQFDGYDVVGELNY